MHHTYREKGKYLDFDLLFALLKDFPMHILLWLCIMSFSCISAVTLEYMFEHFERMERGWGEIVMIMLYVSSAASLYIIPPYIALQRDMSPLLRGALAMQICVNAFKLHSYFMTNRYLRKSRKTKPKTYKQDKRAVKPLTLNASTTAKSLSTSPLWYSTPLFRHLSPQTA